MDVENGVNDICRYTEVLRKEAVQLPLVHRRLHTDRPGAKPEA